MSNLIKRNEEINKKIVCVIIIGFLLVALVPIIMFAINSITDRPEKKVLAFYYTWWGNQTDYTNASLGTTDPGTTEWWHWNNDEFPNPTPSGYTGENTPTLGLYDSSDPKLIETHFNMAEDAGIDAFICTWWGSGGREDINFDNLFKMANNLSTSIKLCPYFETNQLRYSNESDISKIIEDISSEVKYILGKYSDSPYFFKENGKPVVFFYTTALFNPLIWNRIINNIKNVYDCILIADVAAVSELRTELFSSFDGVHIYNPTFIIDTFRGLTRDPSTFGTIEDNYKSMALTCQSYNKICALTTIPGYDDRIIRDPGILVGRESGNTYDYLWDKCLVADWVLITSFNEWHEGTDIEPSEEYGDYYLTRTKYWAEIFKYQ